MPVLIANGTTVRHKASLTNDERTSVAAAMLSVMVCNGACIRTILALTKLTQTARRTIPAPVILTGAME